MITAVIQIGRQTAAIELPQDRFSLQYWLAQMGIRERPENIPISNGKGQPISVTLDAESNIGKSLAALFTEKNTLDEANVCAHMPKTPEWKFERSWNRVSYTNNTLPHRS